MSIKQKISVRYVIVFLTILVLLNTHCAPIGQQFGIIFSANLDGNQDLYRVDGQGFQSMERLTFTPIDPEQDLKVTKDGGYILFYVPGPDSKRIISESLTPPATYAHTYILNLETKTTMEIGDTLGLYPTVPLDWSIDENHVILSEISSTRKIYTVNPDKKNIKELNIPPSGVDEVYELSYSPDGKQVLYNLFNKNADPILRSFLYDLETKAEIQLGTSAAMCSHPQWSPSGKQILLYCNLSIDGISEDSHIYVYDVSDNNPVTLEEIADLPCGLQFGWSPGAKYAWSPDGTQFVAAYCKTDDASRSLFIFNSDGSINRVFPTLGTLANPMYISEVSWSPDGQKILYIAGKDENSLNIYMVNSDGSNNHVVTTQPSNYSELSIYSPQP